MPYEGISENTIILFVCPPKFYISIVFVFSWDHCKVPRETGNNAYVKCGETNKEYYGIFRSGLFMQRVYGPPLLTLRS